MDWIGDWGLGIKVLGGGVCVPMPRRVFWQYVRPGMQLFAIAALTMASKEMVVKRCIFRVVFFNFCIFRWGKRNGKQSCKKVMNI